MIKDEKNNSIIIDSLGNANNATNQRSKFLSIFKQYKDLISILVLVIGAFNAFMAQLLCYLQRRARADYYKINEDYLDDNSLSFWFLFTILIIGVVLAVYLICFYALFISKTKRRYFITALIHIVLLYSIEAYFIYWCCLPRKTQKFDTQNTKFVLIQLKKQQAPKTKNTEFKAV